MSFFVPVFLCVCASVFLCVSLSLCVVFSVSVCLRRFFVCISVCISDKEFLVVVVKSEGLQ